MCTRVQSFFYRNIAFFNIFQNKDHTLVETDYARVTGISSHRSVQCACKRFIGNTYQVLEMDSVQCYNSILKQGKLTVCYICSQGDKMQTTSVLKRRAIPLYKMRETLIIRKAARLAALLRQGPILSYRVPVLQFDSQEMTNVSICSSFL